MTKFHVGSSFIQLALRLHHTGWGGFDHFVCDVGRIQFFFPSVVDTIFSWKNFVKHQLFTVQLHLDDLSKGFFLFVCLFAHDSWFARFYPRKPFYPFQKQNETYLFFLWKNMRKTSKIETGENDHEFFKRYKMIEMVRSR